MAAAGKPASASASGGLQAMVDGARKEGALNLVWGEGTEGGSKGIEQIAAGFNKAYGLDLKVQFTPGPSMPDMGAKMIQEVQTNRPATSDLYIGYAVHMATAVQANALEPVDWASWAPNIKDPSLVAANGAVVTFETSLDGIGYNTQKLTGSAIPKSLQDLLKPEYKGKLASTPYAANFDYLAMDQMWGEQKTVDFITKFSAQLAGLIRCDEMSRLATGEFEAMALLCSQNNVFQEKAKGSPVDVTMPTDASMLIPLYIGVPKNSAHPNAAKLWVNYLLGREGQDILYKYDFQDAQQVPGSKTAPQLAAMKSAGVQLTTVDLATMQAQDPKEYARRRSELQKILTGK
ncbi:MAG TPA: ABC transporter substrate-binding protein [Chloroflexota bacterium]|nr:ABC transporter substrate-binding protein [Chloroflexota bacterium]